MRYQLKAVFDELGQARHTTQAGPTRPVVKWRRHAAASPPRYLPQRLDRGQLDTARAAGAADVHASAAFSFARRLHENERFRNRSWNEAYGDLKVLWEAHDPAGPGWESAESALHRGWDSTRPEIDDDSYRRSHWNASYGKQAAQHRAKRERGPGPASAAAEPACEGNYPSKPTSWENFVDAVKHGWERIRLAEDFDEAGYRLHHARTYPHTNYDDIAPVYRYGNNLHRRRAYRDRSWDAAEPELRAEWERGHCEGKPLTWDETKAALHHGWDQTRI